MTQVLGRGEPYGILVSPKAMEWGNVSTHAVYLPSQRKKLNPKKIKCKMTQQVSRRGRYYVVPAFKKLYLLLGKSKRTENKYMINNEVLTKNTIRLD